jgi:hypothetical protein
MADFDPKSYSSDEILDMQEHSPSFSSSFSLGGLHEKIP